MSKFDPPASRFDPPPITPPPMQMNQGVEKPPTHHPNTPNPGNEMGHSDAPQKCRYADMMRAVTLGLRGFCLIFSFLCFVIIATIKGFNKVDSANYVFSIALISFVYNAFQNVKGVFGFVNGKELITNEKLSGIIDFIGDQVMTYMLLSASSVGLDLSNQSRQAVDAVDALDYVSVSSSARKVVDKAAGASSMLFFAFLALALATLISGFRLSRAFIISCSNNSN